MSDSIQADKPVFHVAPKEGWVNDPNGPFMYQGKYHLFYQHLPQGCEWAFGLVWGHAVSSDLVHWQHLPHAMVPTEKSLDADGCFSGCATVDTDGTPVLLYTGVRLRTNPDAQPPPPPECDLQLPFIESQLYAVPSNLDDPMLLHWVKEPAPFIGLPPPNMKLTGWRDPFVVERPCEANNWEWIVLMGSGIKEVGGATIVYRTKQLRDASSWRYDGLLCVGDGETGAVWECPLVAELNPLPAGGVPLGSITHDRLALGTRRSYSQLAGSGSALSSIVSSPSAEQQHWQKHEKQPDKQQQQADKQQQQQPDKQQQHEQHSAAHSNSTTSSNDSSSTHDGGTFGSSLHADGSGSLVRSSSSSGRQRSGPLQTTAGALALCGSGKAFPCFVSSNVPLSNWDERYTHFYSISPDACTNPTIYWLGRYEHGRFDLDNAKGPLRLDLGDVLYAPNVMRDDAGRVILWGWLQERRSVGTYDYAGCMTVPRLLHLDHDRLHQSPAPELLSLRRGEAWQCAHVSLGPEASLSLPGVVGSNFLDIEVVFVPSTATTVGVLLRSWHQGGEGGAAVLFNWESGLLEVVFEALDPATMSFSLTAPLARRIGGPVMQKPGAPLALRLLLDGSCLEIFTGSGEVLSTRIYRGAPPHNHADAGIEFVALDGEATLERVAAYEMASIWHKEQQQQQQAAAAAVAAAAEALEGLDLGLDLLANVTDREQQQLEKALSLTQSLGTSLKEQGIHMPLSPALSDKLQQLLLSPRATAAAAAIGQTPFGGAFLQQEHHELPLEEEMTADIFDLE